MEPLQMFPMLCNLVPLSTYSSLSWGWNLHKRIQIFRLGEWEFSISLQWPWAFWILSNVGVFALICGSRDKLCSLTLAQVFISTPKIMSECYAVLPKCFIQYLFSTLSPVDRDLIILCATDDEIIKLFVFSETFLLFCSTVFHQILFKASHNSSRLFCFPVKNMNSVQQNKTE